LKIASVNEYVSVDISLSDGSIGNHLKLIEIKLLMVNASLCVQ